MRSNAIASGLSDAFYGDLSLFTALPEAVITEAAKLLDKAAESSREIDDEELIPLAKAHNLTSYDLSHGLSAAIYLLDQSRDRQDSLDAIVEDLSELGKISDPANLRRRLQLFDEGLQERFLRFRREQEAIGAAFPQMSHFHTTVTTAFSFGKGFNPRKDSADTYSPKIYSAVPAVVLQFDINSFGEEQSVSFGCSVKKLAEVINHLELTMKEALAVKAALQKDKSA